MAGVASIDSIIQDYNNVTFGFAAYGAGSADYSEMVSWIGQGYTNPQVAYALATSATALYVVDPIIRLYQTVFDRAPDRDGLAGWVAAVESGSVTLAGVAQAFAQSYEFMARYGSYDPGHLFFVQALYQNALNRGGDVTGLTAWALALDHGAVTIAQVLLGFSQSQEFTTAAGAAIQTWQANYAISNSYTPYLPIGGNTSLQPPSSGPTYTQPTTATTFTLTTGADTSPTFLGSPQNDTYNAALSVSGGALTAASTLTPGDSLDGSGGTDTLNVAISGASLGGAYTATPKLTSIEQVFVANTATDTVNAVTIDLSQADTALATIGTSSSSTAGVTTKFANLPQLVAVQMAGAGNLSVAFASAVDAGPSDSVNLTLNGVGTSASALATFTVDSGIETLAITSATSANYLKLADPGLRTVTVTGGQALTLDLSAVAGAQSVTLAAGDTGAATIAIAAGSVGTITNSANVALTVSGAAAAFNGLTVAGGTGTDALSATADGTTSVNLSHITGVETLTVLASGGNAAGFTVGGVDTVVAAGATLTVNASAVSAAAFSFNGTGETDGHFNFVGGAGSVSITGGAGGDTYDFTTASLVFNNTDTIVGGAGSDTLNIGKVTATSALDNVSGIETIVFSNTAAVNITTVDSLVGTGKTLTVDASALTGANSFTWNGAAETNGSFTITAGSSNATITGGAGADVIHGGVGTNTLSGGGGNDTLYGGSGQNTVDGGAGANTIVLGSHTSDTLVISSTAGTDTVSGMRVTDTLEFVLSGTAGRYISLGGTAITSSSQIWEQTSAGAIVGSTFTPVVFTAVANTLANDAALVNSLAVGGTNALTLGSASSVNDEILLIYSDGTNGHVVAVNFSAAATTFTAAQMSVIDLANLTGVSSTAGWGALSLQFV